MEIPSRLWVKFSSILDRAKMGAIKYLLVVFPCIFIADAATIRLYSSPTAVVKDGLFFEATNVSTQCSNVVHGLNWVLIGTIWTDSCIMVYSQPNCQSYSKRFDPSPVNMNSLSGYWEHSVRSYTLCNEENGGKDSHFTVYHEEAFTNKVLDYRNVCECTNIPKYFGGNMNYLDTHGNQFLLYTSYNCMGGSYSPERGRMKLIRRYLSFKPTCLGPFCRRINLKAVITKVEIHPILRNENMYTVELSTTDLIQNNGSATIIKEYSVENSLMESSTVTNTRSLEKFSSVTNQVGVEVKVEASASANFGFGSASLSTSVSSSFSKAWTSSETSTDTHSNARTVEHTKTYAIRQSFEIPPCTVYEVSSFVKVLKDVTASYTAYMTISGTSNEKVMTYSQVHTEVRTDTGLKFVRYEGNNVIVKLEGSYIGTIGMDAVVDGNGRPIIGCLTSEINPNATVPLYKLLHRSIPPTDIKH